MDMYTHIHPKKRKITHLFFWAWILFPHALQANICLRNPLIQETIINTIGPMPIGRWFSPFREKKLSCEDVKNKYLQKITALDIGHFTYEQVQVLEIKDFDGLSNLEVLDLGPNQFDEDMIVKLKAYLNNFNLEISFYPHATKLHAIETNAKDTYQNNWQIKIAKELIFKEVLRSSFRRITSEEGLGAKEFLLERVVFFQNGRIFYSPKDLKINEGTDSYCVLRGVHRPKLFYADNIIDDETDEIIVSQVRLKSGFSLNIHDVIANPSWPYAYRNQNISMQFKPSVVYSMKDGFYLDVFECNYKSFTNAKFTPEDIDQITGGFINFVKKERIGNVSGLQISEMEEKRHFIINERVFAGDAKTLNNIHKSIAKIHSSVFDSSGSGFFIEGNILVTNFHVLDALIDGKNDADLNSIVITMANDRIPKTRSIKGIIAADFLLDLVLLEVDEVFLQNKELTLSHSPIKDETSLYVLGFPQGKFKTIPLEDVWDSDDFYMVTNSYKGLINGASGSPMINEKGEVFAVVSKVFPQTNTINVIKGEHLQMLLSEKYGQPIGNDEVFDWMKEQRNEWERMANAGNMRAQLNMSDELRDSLYGKFFSEENEQIFKEAMDYLIGSAEQGYITSRLALGLMYCLGSMDFLKENHEESSRWFSGFSVEVIDIVMLQKNRENCLR